MKKNSSVFWFLFFISLLWIYFNLDFFTSIIHGLHTKIYPRWEKSIAIVVVYVFLFIVIVLKDILKPKIRNKKQN